MGDLERDLDFDFKGLRFLLSRSAILENVHVMINLGSRPHGHITAASLKSAGYTGCTACVAAMVTDQKRKWRKK